MGKTVVAAAMIAVLRESGVRVAPMKPIGRVGATDADRLITACGVAYPVDLVRPVSFSDRAAPLVASRRAHEPIDIDSLDRAFGELCTRSDAVIVEDSGGLLTPITETENFATLFRRWGLDLVIVSPNDAGSVNQVLMAIEVAHAHNLRITAVVLTTLTRDRHQHYGGPAQRTNQALLKELLLRIPVVTVPYHEHPDDPRSLAAVARELALHSTITRGA